MSNLVYQNLDTSFVNLPALIRHLHGKGFIGTIQVETSGYEAEIALNGTEEIEVRERDLMTGRTAEGEEAMQRLLVRARTVGGVINVQKAGIESSPVMSLSDLRPEPQIPIVNARASAIVENVPVIDIPLAPFTEDPSPVVEQKSVFTEIVGQLRETPMSTPAPEMVDADWQELLTLTVELLASIDRSLAASRLDFQAAFAKASSELANDYLFLRAVSYSGGRLTVNERPDPNQFVSGVMDVLRRVMHRLGANPQFVELHRNTAERLVGLVHKNKERYDRYHVTTPLYRVLGVYA